MLEKYYHGSPDNGVAEILRPSESDRPLLFYGMFFGDWDVAKSHAAPYIYSVEVEQDNLIEAFRFAYDDDAYKAIKESFGEPLENEELFHDLISHHASLWDNDVELSEEEKEKLNKVFGEVLGDYPGTDIYELDWAFQSASAFIAEKLGYEGVWVPDEHGTSLIVTPGHKLHQEV